MDNELDPYPGNLKQHVVKVTKQDIDADGMLKALKGGDIVLMRDNVEELKSLLREGEQFMQHKKGCEYGKIHWTRSERSRFEMHRNMNCTCGLSQYMEKIKDRTK